MKDYVLSAKAILYAAKKAGAQSFTGLPNALYGIDKAAEAKIIREAEDELTEAGLMELDFDGKSTIEKELLDMVLTCSNVSQITGYDLKLRDGSVKSANVYLDREGRRYFLTSLGREDKKYTFGEKNVEDIRDIIRQSIEMPAGNADSRSFTVETSLLSNPEKNKLVEAGVDEDAADLIEKAINSGEYALTMSRFINSVEDTTSIYMWNDGLILEMNIVYEDDKENARFTTCTSEDVFKKMFELIEKPVIPESEKDD